MVCVIHMFQYLEKRLIFGFTKSKYDYHLVIPSSSISKFKAQVISSKLSFVGEGKSAWFDPMDEIILDTNQRL